ncbi:hypothetical protein SASPL_130881 [Salvia splendens]|uniref:TOD1/MUCI70 glycosyltransferase-like domain-containing protein n=1 Tax=Salvia splendens TaxID=180675 RepID=A0A8X8X9X1_SALSN|nr:hypothetical protein SASPL_130881 [Salvia splendens]
MHWWFGNKSQIQNEKHLLASRRGRKFGRISTKMLLLAVLFLIYFTYFGIKMHLYETVFLEEAEEETKANGVPEQRKNVSNYVKEQPKKPHRQRYFPCEVPFLDSVTYLQEPEDNVKLARFSLRYLEREQGILPSEARFGGHQTFMDREKSFHATNQTIRCGFVRGPDGFPSTGFDLDEEDKKFMNACKIVVSSCIFGSFDFLRRPTSKLVAYAVSCLALCRLISEYSKKNVCFVMFVDTQTLAKLSSEGNIPDEKGHIGLWRIVVVKNLPYEDMRKTGKVPKFCLIAFSRLLDPDIHLPSFVPEGSFIVRAHTAMSNLFSCLWFNEVDRFTSRDQLSFAYTYLKLRRLNPDKPFYLNMFKHTKGDHFAYLATEFFFKLLL